MKKKMALIMTFAMASMLALAGCGGASKAPAKETQAATEAAAETEAATEAAAETEAAETEAAGTEAAETEADETVSEEEALAALGHVDDNVYTNDTFGLRFEATDDWYIASPEEMAQIQGMAADAVEDEDLAQQLRESGSIYDFYAQNTENSANINVIIQDVGLLQGLLIANSNKLIEQSIPQVETALKSAGYEVTRCEQDTVTFKGEDRDCIATEFTTQGIEVSQRQVYEVSDNFLAIITVSAASAEDAQAVFDLFK